MADYWAVPWVALKEHPWVGLKVVQSAALTVCLLVAYLEFLTAERRAALKVDQWVETMVNLLADSTAGCLAEHWGQTRVASMAHHSVEW